MTNSEEWIKSRAYHNWEIRTAFGYPDNPLENWLLAERDYEQKLEHDKDFHKRFDIEGKVML